MSYSYINQKILEVIDPSVLPNAISAKNYSNVLEIISAKNYSNILEMELNF